MTISYLNNYFLYFLIIIKRIYYIFNFDYNFIKSNIKVITLTYCIFIHRAFFVILNLKTTIIKKSYKKTFKLLINLLKFMFNFLYQFCNFSYKKNSRLITKK